MPLADTWEVETVRDGLIAAVRAVLHRQGIGAETVMHLGEFLRAVERLPECDEASMATLRFSKCGMTWEAVIASDELRLSEIVTHRWECGTDHETRVLLRATDEACEADWQFMPWLRDFVTMAGDTQCEAFVWCDALNDVTCAVADSAS